MLNRSQSPRKRSVDGLTRKSTGQGSAFFAELDQTKNKFHGFWFVAIILLLVIFAGLLIVAVNFKRKDIAIKKPTDITGNIDNSFTDRLSSISSVGLTTMDFNSQEFVDISGAGGSDFPLAKSQFTFSKDQIMLSGKVRGSLIPISVHLKIDASVVGDKFIFIIAPNNLENIVVYGNDKDKIEQTFDQNLNQVLKDKNIIAKSLSVSDDLLELQVIKGQK